ncbi:MAG: hypothetical protein HYZ28_20875 [Myxococcales bacterium]|nr:hypothetical protein [Myxococcales bacterium]
MKVQAPSGSAGRGWLLTAAGTLAGALSGAASQLHPLAELEPSSLTRELAARSLGSGALAGGASLLALWLVSLRLARRFLSAEAYPRFTRLHRRSFAALAALAVPAALLSAGWLIALLAAFGLASLVLAAASMDEREREHRFGSFGALGALFLVSGAAALVYQVSWQRAMFASFGVNIESVTVIVTTFMFGLGLGSLAGGALSRRHPRALVLLFVAAEALIGAFGLLSLPLIRGVGALMVRQPLPPTALAIFALLAIPTLLMGATLPVLVTYVHQRTQHVGRSVGALYFVNTLGSALACFLAADVLFVFGGLTAAVRFAAGCNFAVALLVYRLARGSGRERAR